MGSDSGNWGGDIANAWDNTAGNVGRSVDDYAHTGKIGGSVGQAWGFLTQWAHKPSMPQTQAAAPLPTQGQANVTALQAQLDREKQLRSSSNNPTGGAGVLDTPTTASRVLLGS